MAFHVSQHEPRRDLSEFQISQHAGPLNLRAEAVKVNDGLRRYDPAPPSEVRNVYTLSCAPSTCLRS